MMPALSVKWAACHDSVFHSVLGMAQMGREKRSARGSRKCRHRFHCNSVEDEVKVAVNVSITAATYHFALLPLFYLCLSLSDAVYGPDKVGMKVLTGKRSPNPSYCHYGTRSVEYRY
jgi:hypothetical protein